MVARQSGAKGKRCDEGWMLSFVRVLPSKLNQDVHSKDVCLLALLFRITSEVVGDAIPAGLRCGLCGDTLRCVDEKGFSSTCVTSAHCCRRRPCLLPFQGRGARK